MQYKVTKQYIQRAPVLFAKFSDLSDAKLFISTKLAADAMMNVRVVYRIFEDDELLGEFAQEEGGSTSGTQTVDSQSTRSAAGFRPTPLSTTPRPRNSPAGWLVDDDKDDDLEH